MTRFPALAVAASAIAAGTALLSFAAFAAPAPERIRGTVASLSGDTLIVHTANGSDLSVTLTDRTRYQRLIKSSLDRVTSDSYIGTATKAVGEAEVALEVVVFPRAMRGTGEGHYPWDRIPDTTLSGAGVTTSSMTNGTVSAVASIPGHAVNSTMTNGTITAVGTAPGVKQITVNYKGGSQTIIVPPTAPIVTFTPGMKSDVMPGAAVFVNAVKQGGQVTANAVSIGTDGVKPPM